MAETDDNFDKIMAELDAEEKSEKVPEKKESSNKSSYAHEEILKEEGLTKDDLPADIRKMIITFDRKLRMATVKKAPEATMLKIQNLSTLIGDKIVTWLESDESTVQKVVINKKEDGGAVIDDAAGGSDDGLDDGGDDSVIDDGDTTVEDDLEDGSDDGAAGGEASKGGLFDGVLGGIFNWNN